MQDYKPNESRINFYELPTRRLRKLEDVQPMNASSGDFIRVGTLAELQAKGMMVVPGRQRPLVVVYHNAQVYALDNRCPHLGFPLHRGTVEDGILTCHWHHARFDLASGCTFDLWADDVPRCPVEVRNGEVWVAADCSEQGKEHWKERLERGMEQNIGLVIGKASIGWLRAGGDFQELVRDAALFGARFRDGWASGLTILTALANLVPVLPEMGRYMAMFHGIGRVASDCDGHEPRRDRQPLEGDAVPPATLKRWLRYWSLVRHRDGAERTLLTAIERGESLASLAEMLLTAATDRFFSDSGHTVDFINKALECLDIIGWQHASAVLPSVVRQLVSARGSEESNAWRHPIDLVPLLNNAVAAVDREVLSLSKDGPRSPEPFEGWTGNRGGEIVDRGSWTVDRERRADAWTGHQALAQDVLGDDPHAVMGALTRAVRDGAKPVDLSRAVAYAAALRIARFGTVNEFGDWITALHTFTYCNAIHQILTRISRDEKKTDGVSSEALRGVFHGAMAVYLDRFLNIPPAKLPEADGHSLDDLPAAGDELCSHFLDLLDRQQQVDAAARVVARYVALGHPIEPLFATLAHAVLREDADFHTYQMLEAGIRQYQEWGAGEEGRNILIAVARYLAAHSPTQRALFQTATVALRLHRGDKIYEDESEASPV